MSRKQITFFNSDQESLSAVLELPLDRHPGSFALFAHCFTCNKNFKAVRSISRELSSHGFGVLSFDFTGLGASEGEFSDTNFSSSVDDLICAANHLSANYAAPVLIVGHSLGGSAGLLAASQLESVTAVVTIGSPADPGHVKNLFEADISKITEAGFATVSIGGRPFTVKKQLIEDLERQDLPEVVGSTRKAYLFMHSPQDKTVGIDNAARLYAAAKHPKSFISLDGADHLLSNPEDASYAGQIIANWAGRYLAAPQESTDLETARQLVAYLGPDEKFTTEIRADRHRLIADEPVSFGGNDFGPSPYQLIASGLAACTVMTLRLYADRKKWDLREIYCHVSHEKNHLEDCGNCEDPKARIDRFSREIELIGALDDGQTDRLLEIANKCPVHKTLENKAHIETVLLNR